VQRRFRLVALVHLLRHRVNQNRTPLRAMRSRPYPEDVGRPHELVALALAGCAAGGNVTPSTSNSTVATSNDTDSTTSTPIEDESGIATAASGEASASSTGDETASADETSCEEVSWYADMDGDGRGDPALPMMACDPPPGHVAFGDDCDDTEPMISPAAHELCDGIDNDCDTLVDELSAMNATCNGCTLAESDQHAYALCPVVLSWDAARTSCAAFGGDLLALEDDAEQAVVIAFAEPMPTGPGGWFFGLNDRTTEGVFLWPDGRAPSFTSWGVGEPNDASANEDCGEMSLGVATWNDVPCADARAYVCEAVPP
jgi:hypothetical protein